MFRFAKVTFVFIALLSIGFLRVSAQTNAGESDHSSGMIADEVNQGEKSSPDGKFKAGDFVIEDVSDAYDWHIVTFGNTNISIPLPVILYSRHPGLHGGKRFFVFMSTKFQHGKVDYDGFRISDEKENQGKIVELDATGAEIGKPIDISITKAIAGVIVSVILLLWIFLGMARSAKQNVGKAPRGMQNLLEPVVVFIRDEVARPAIGDKRYERYLPFLLTLFFFILLNSLLGLIPIFPFGANVTGNVAVTGVLALFTFVITTFSGNKHYWKEIYNPDVPWWFKFPFPLMPLVEVTGVFTKPFVLMIRLFANMLAGHMIVATFIALIFVFAKMAGPMAGMAVSPISVLFSVFIVLLDVLVAFIQAYVFVLLSALYFGMATEDHH